MKKLPLMLAALFCLGAVGQSVAQAQTEVIVEKSHRRTKQVYVIEDHRPVRRTVFIDERGRYYREDGGRRVFIERHFDEYPSQYFYRDGRQRSGIKIVF